MSGLHEIYYEVCGNPKGKPALFLHGGPGAGSTPAHRQLWNPDAYMIVLIDQRGSGRSRPHGELRENTTWHLVADIEHLRTHIGVDRWQILGGSWGSALALAYAQQHANRVSELILRGVFLGRRAEVSWLYQDGASWIYPDHFHNFRTFIGGEESYDLIAAYHHRLTDKDEHKQTQAARAWAHWEGSILRLNPNQATDTLFSADHSARALARIECHYFHNDCWFDPSIQLLQNAARLRGIPGFIVQGRYDTVTPTKSAWELHQVWPESELVITPAAGHAYDEPANLSALLDATDHFA